MKNLKILGLVHLSVDESGTAVETAMVSSMSDYEGSVNESKNRIN